MPYRNSMKQRAEVRRLQNGKRAALYQIKEQTPCADCGQRWPHYVMDFDHTGPKRFAISKRSASFGSALVREELARADLVCANCHRIRTHKRGQPPKDKQTPLW